MLQLNPPLPLITPRGKGLAILVTDPGTEHHLEWTVLLDNCEIWTFRNPEVRGQENVTAGRPVPPWWKENNDRALGKSDPEPCAHLNIKSLDRGQWVCMDCQESNLREPLARQPVMRAEHPWETAIIGSRGDVGTGPVNDTKANPETLEQFIGKLDMAQAPLHALVTRVAQFGEFKLRLWRGPQGEFNCAAIVEHTTKGAELLMARRCGQNHPLHSDSGGTAMKSALMEVLLGELGRDAAPWFRPMTRPNIMENAVTNGPLGQRVVAAETVATGARAETDYIPVPEDRGHVDTFKHVLGDQTDVGRLWGRSMAWPQHLEVDIAGERVRITKRWLERALEQFTE